MGSRRAARIAGYSPKNSPTSAVIEMPSATDHGSTLAGTGVSAAMTSNHHERTTSRNAIPYRVRVVVASWQLIGRG